MKKVKILLFFMCFFSIFVFTGCETKQLSSAKIFRDDARTGGSLSFVYDKEARKVYIGGKGEIVQYSSADENRSLDAGCRIGIKVVAPDEDIDVSSAILEMNDINYSADEFLEKINGQVQRFFNIYPLFSEENDTMKFYVVWQEGAEKQEYELKIMKGTRFMDKDGNVS